MKILVSDEKCKHWSLLSDWFGSIERMLLLVFFFFFNLIRLICALIFWLVLKRTWYQCNRNIYFLICQCQVLFIFKCFMDSFAWMPFSNVKEIPGFCRGPPLTWTAWPSYFGIPRKIFWREEEQGGYFGGKEGSREVPLLGN